MKLFKITSVLLSVAMCMSFVMTPVCVFADETEAPAETSESTESKETEESKETVKATEPSKETKPAESAPETTGENAPDESVPETSKIELPVQNKENEEPSEAAPSESQPEEASECETVPSETVPPQTDRKVRKNSVVASGKCGDNLTWTIDAQGTLTVSGTGEMDTWSDESKRPWKPYLDSIKTVKFMEGVISIGQCAFISCKNITSVSLPSTLTAISHDAFQGCANLPAVSLPDGLKSIGVWAFADCDSLTAITIPNSVTSIGGGAFMNCDNLKDVIIDEEFYKSIGYDPFDRSNNVALHFVSSYDEITYIKTNNATNGTGTVKVAGASSKVVNVIIPAVVVLDGISYKVTAIDSNAFRGNLKITTVSIGSNVTSIGNNAFYGCIGLTKVSGGAKVKTIGSNAFAYCSKLSSFTISSKVLSKIGAQAFNKDKKLKTLNIKKTTKLTKKGVKKSLKGSSIKTVKVKKSKVKKYKKIFKKKNSGRKVKVKK